MNVDINAMRHIGFVTGSKIVKRRAPRFMLIFLWCFVCGGFLGGEEIWHESKGWSLNIPETWQLVQGDDSGRSYSFSDTRNKAYLQVFDLDTSGSREAAETLNMSIRQGLAARLADGGETDFLYNGANGRLADITWSNAGIPVRGYLMTFDGKAILAFSVSEDWEGYHDFLLSVLDSYSAGEESRYLPGPVSQLIADDGWYGGSVTNVQAQNDTAQAVVERESRVLYAYLKADSETQSRAWRRYYQMIYRDNYARLADVSEAFIKVFHDSGTPRDEIPGTLLAWIQDFEYEDVGGLSDLRAPVSAVHGKIGDCDARCLVYMILLDRMGFDTLLMISPVFQHSLVGIDMNGQGARFSWEGTQWLVAETTAKVPLGQIAAQQSDPKNWMGFELGFKP